MRATYSRLKKIAFRVLALSCVQLLILSAAPAQTSARTDAKASRRVKGQTLISAQLPPVRIKFGKAFRYVGSQRFILYERAQVEQYFFVDADSRKRIRRMFMLQFEGYLPGIDGSYNYPQSETVNLGGESYLANAEIVPGVSAALKQNPQSDIAHAAALLEGKGYHVNDMIAFQRFVRLVDEAKRNEFILLYIEDLSGAGLTTSDFTAGGRAAASRREKILAELSARAQKNFRVLK